MKKSLIIALMISLLGMNAAYAGKKGYGVSQVKLVPNNKNVSKETVVELVQFLQPSLNDADAEKVATSVLKYSKDINLDWRIFISILFQESSLTLDPQNCYMNELHPPMVRIKTKKHGKVEYKLVQKKAKRCMDYGIAQINFRTWGDELDLNKELLVTDIDYSINAASKILFYYKARYSKHDRRWHLRYHSNTPEFKDAYGKVIHKRFNKIDKFVKEGK